VSQRGASFACLAFGNPLGLYAVYTLRAGTTDPSICSAPYLDWMGVPRSCPVPSNASSVYVCGAL
jgi:hypothetical protein